MLSLISNAKTAQLAVLAACLIFQGSVALAAGDHGQAFLETPTVTAVGSDGEIRIGFSTDVRYIRHYPEGKGNVLRVNIEVVDPCEAEDILSQETRWPQPAEWYVPFTVTFPESIRRPTSGPAICQATHNHVYVSHTLSIKFTKEVEYKVRPGGDGRSIVVVVPLIKQPEAKKVPAKVREPEVVKKPDVPSAPAAQAAAAIAPKPDAGTPVAAQPKVEAAPKVQLSPKQEPQVPVKVEAKPTGPVEQPTAAAKPVPSPAPVPVKQAVLLPAPKTEPELPAADLLAAGRAALAAGDGIQATQYFNRLLNLPPNPYSQEGQELVGVAREKADEADKAIVEYELYLKLYPEGEGAARVKQRLAALVALKEAPKKVKQQAAAKPKKAIKEIHQNTLTGSVSQYYYAGKSQGRTNVAGDITKSRSTDQSTLITNFDVTERMRHNQYDTKIVFRDTQVHNFLPGRIDRNTVSSAYVEHQNKELDYMFRLGRQSGTSQGVLGRFDGVFGRYGLNPQWRLTAVAGVPDNGSQNKVKTDRYFYGAGIEFGPLAEKWSGTVYGIQQIADGLVERRAIGTEARYFSGTTSWFGLLDYDTLYDSVNMAMVQGNWVAWNGYNFNMLVDHRKSPILYGETAIQSVTGALSVQDVRRILSSGELYSTVRALVPESDMAMIGVNKQITERWQLGGDVRVVHIGPTDGTQQIDGILGVQTIAAQPGIKNNFTYTLQAIGSNTLFKNDTSVIMASHVEDPAYNAQNLSFSHSLMLGDRWRVDTSLRYYQEHRDAGQKTWQFSPSLRANYRFRDNMSFEAQLNVDRTHTDDPGAITTTDNWREMLFAGYRWDFR